MKAGAAAGSGELLARAFPHARVGVITPGANPALEFEVRAALPEQVAVHATRLPPHAGMDLAGRVAAYRADVAGAVASFGDLPLTAILFGCTASSYPHGPDGDRALSRSVQGPPLVTAAGAVGDLLGALGVRRIHLVSPYPDWLTRQCVSYWNQAGYPVATVTPVRSPQLYQTTDRDTYAAVTAALPGAAAPTDAAAAARLAKERALRQISQHKLLIRKGFEAKQRGDTNAWENKRLARIDAFLKLGTQQGCSDVHLAVGVPPMLRMHGDLLPIKFRDLRLAELEGYITEILTRSQNEHFNKGLDLDFSYVSADGGRFRVNVYRKETGIGATFRSIPSEVPTLEKLALPPIVTKLCDFHQGMVLVTGSTGTGKSTTLAAMIDHLNSTRRLNIISLEDPIEFVHPSKQSQVIQRELGTHIPSFAEGVRAAMREDPDVILVGELRDAETISMAMTAAETGHLVLGTLHTTGAVKTIDRVIDALPVEEREQTKSFLAQSLLAVVTQVLVKNADSNGRKAICEILMMTKAIAKLIQTEQTHQIPSQLQMGRDLGMQLLDQALLAAIQARTVDPDDAYNYATDKRAFQKFVTDTSMLPKLDSAPPAPAA